MARLPRLFVPGLAQHVLQGGAGGALVAPDAEARDALQAFIGDAVRSHQVALHAFAVLPTHFHLLATAPEPTALARTLQSIGRRYVQYFNVRTGREGKLWEARYRSCVVQAERFVMLCMRYIDHEPVRLGLVQHPEQYVWSSYRQHSGIEALPYLTDHGAYWALGNTPFERQNAYRVCAADPVRDEERSAIRAATSGGWGLGDAQFLEQVTRIALRRSAPEARGRRRATPPADRSCS